MKLNLLCRCIVVSSLLLAASTMSWAYDFEVDGIYYEINEDETSVTVASYNNEGYPGDLIIPSYVTYNDKDYRVSEIGQAAFWSADGITSITVGSRVRSIGYQAFPQSNNVKSIVVSADNPVYDSRNGCNAIIETATNTLVHGCKNTVIPDGVEHIYDYAFYGCTYLSSINIPGSVKSIGKNAFDRCDHLASLTFSEGLLAIGPGAFGGCKYLNAIVFPNTLTTIGDGAFSWCENIRSITLGSGLKTIGAWAFNYCKTPFSITIPEGVTNIGHGAFDCSGLVSINIPASMTTIDDCALQHCYYLKSVTISEGVKYIGGRAFYCSALTAVNIPSSVISIGTEAFDGCNLKSVTINDGVTSIGAGAFEGNSYLTSINIPNSVTTIGPNAFEGCTSLPVTENIRYADCCLVEAVNKEQNSYKIKEETRFIGSDAFLGCSNLTSIIIPETVTEIGDRTFCDCNSLESVTSLATRVPQAGSSAFYCSSLGTAKLYVPVSALYAYRSAAEWKDFGAILPISDGGDVYIETDVTSQFPVDWQGWTGATDYVGWAAPQVTTNDGRTTAACESYKETCEGSGDVMTRMLTGLTNGTYRIELYGAAAFTPDRGFSSDIVEGDESAVCLYAETSAGRVEKYIPAHVALDFNGSGIATAVLEDVQVTDGTVKIGMSKTKAYTNWHVVQIKGVTAIVDAVEYHAAVLYRAESLLDDAAYANITGAERATLMQVVSDNASVTEHTPESYQSAADAVKAVTSAFTSAKESYDSFAAAKILTANCNFPYASARKKVAAERAATVTCKSAADALSKTESLLKAYRQYSESSAMLGGVEGCEDVTDTYIVNPKAEADIDASVWNTVLGAGSEGSVVILEDEPWTDGNDGTAHRYFDGGNWGASAWDVTFKQDITLPAGRYQLTAMGRSAQDVTLILFAGEVTAEMAHFNAEGGLFNRGWEQTSLEFELMQETTISIGVRGVTNVERNWMSFSDFRLMQFPASMTAIGEVKAGTESDAADQNPPIYDLSGRALNEKPASGYYIQGGKKYFVK